VINRIIGAQAIALIHTLYTTDNPITLVHMLASFPPPPIAAEQELAEMGLRLAEDWESGWYVTLEDGRTLWVTDAANEDDQAYRDYAARYPNG
jgi:hypothetical protein